MNRYGQILKLRPEHRDEYVRHHAQAFHAGELFAEGRHRLIILYDGKMTAKRVSCELCAENRDCAQKTLDLSANCAHLGPIVRVLVR